MGGAKSKVKVIAVAPKEEQWAPYRVEIAAKPRGYHVDDAELLVRACWTSYMDPSGYGAVREGVVVGHGQHDRTCRHIGSGRSGSGGSICA